MCIAALINIKESKEIALLLEHISTLLVHRDEPNFLRLIAVRNAPTIRNQYGRPPYAIHTCYPNVSDLKKVVSKTNNQKNERGQWPRGNIVMTSIPPRR